MTSMHAVETEHGLVLCQPYHREGELVAWEVWEPGAAGRLLGVLYPESDRVYAKVDGEEYRWPTRTDGARFFANRQAERDRWGVEP